jgi:peptide/nickel transport system substrate-binding protein
MKIPVRVSGHRAWMVLSAFLALGITAGHAADQPVSGGDFTFGYSSSFVDILDPHVTSQSVSHFIMANLFDPLVYLRTNGEFAAGLAESWAMSADGLVWTFKLKRGVTFHDGTPFNAEAVKFSFDRMVDPETKSRQAGVALRGFYDRTDVADANTVRIVLKKPKASFLTVISQVFFAPVSPKAARELGAEFGRKPVGTGPFKFVEWVQNQHVKLVRNPDYTWGPPFLHKGPAYFATLTFRQIPDAGARLAALESGQVDAVDVPPTHQLERLRADPRFQVKSAPQPGMPWGWPMNTKREPTDDLKVRQAMIYALDRATLVKNVLQGAYKPAYGPLTPVTFGYNPAVEKMYPHDPRKAEALLDEAGWKKGADGLRAKDGKPLVIEHYVFYTTSEAEFVQAALKSVGIKSNISLQEVGTVNQVATEGTKNNLAPLPFASLDPELMSTLFHSRNQGKGFNWTFHTVKEIDDLLDRGEVELDPKKRAEIYGRFQVLAMEHALFLPAFVRETIHVYKAPVQGVQFNRRGYDAYFHDMWWKK